MKYMHIFSCSTSDGPGFRVSLYVSGCRNHCIGCHNPESWDFNAGTEYTIDTYNEILAMCDHPYIQGLTICGGEPFEEENQAKLVKLVLDYKRKFPNKDLWIYTGYELEDLLDLGRKHTDFTNLILSNTDVLVTGPFILDLRDISPNNLWRGSTNQRCLNMPETLKQGKKVFVEGIPNNN